MLADLKTGTLRFKSIELWNEQVRLVGPVGLLTGESRAVTERNSVASESHFRLTAVYTEVAGALRLESTDIVTPKTSTAPNFSGPGAARSFIDAWSQPVVALIPNFINQPQHHGFLVDGTTLVLQTMQTFPDRGVMKTRLIGAECLSLVPLVTKTSNSKQPEPEQSRSLL